MFIVLAFLISCHAPQNGNHAGGTRYLTGVFSLNILRLLIFVHRVISKTYHTCPIIAIQLLFLCQPLWPCYLFRGLLFLYWFFPAIIIFSILGHLPLSFPVISLYFWRTFPLVYPFVLSPSAPHCITPGS